MHAEKKGGRSYQRPANDKHGEGSRSAELSWVVFEWCCCFLVDLMGQEVVLMDPVIEQVSRRASSLYGDELNHRRSTDVNPGFNLKLPRRPKSCSVVQASSFRSK